jgi:hypothetical protein
MLIRRLFRVRSIESELPDPSSASPAFSMARDGLLHSSLARTHPRFRTPHVATILTGLFVGVGSALASLGEMADLCNYRRSRLN